MSNKFVIFVLILLMIIAALVFFIKVGETETNSGDPFIYRWTDVEMRIFWPWSSIPDADYYECLLRAYSYDQRQSYNISLKETFSPAIEHTELYTVFAFGSGEWRAREGSCFIVKDNTVVHSKPIVGLPRNKNDWDGIVYIPSIVNTRYFIAREE